LLVPVVSVHHGILEEQKSQEVFIMLHPKVSHLLLGVYNHGFIDLNRSFAATRT
jgi:hypothetical protein